MVASWYWGSSPRSLETDFKSHSKVNSKISSDSKRLDVWPSAMLQKKEHSNKKNICFIFPVKFDVWILYIKILGCKESSEIVSIILNQYRFLSYVITTILCVVEPGSFLTYNKLIINRYLINWIWFIKCLNYFKVFSICIMWIK